MASSSVEAIAGLGAASEMVFESQSLPPGYEVLLEQKAADLFAICDQEDKGFVTKRDMQRLRDELPLGPDQLENVFDALDGDKNGYLTLEEFTLGFEAFLGLSIPSKSQVSGFLPTFSIVDWKAYKVLACNVSTNKDQQIKELVAKDFNQLCTRIGKSKNHWARAEFKENFTPRQQKGRQVPLCLQWQVEAEIRKLIEQRHLKN